MLSLLSRLVEAQNFLRGLGAGRIRILAHPRSLHYLGVLLALAALGIVVPSTGLRSDATFFMLAGTLAMNLALLTGLVALLYSSGTENPLAVFVGASFLAAALLDGYQVVTSVALPAGMPGETPAVSASRWFLPLWLWFGVWASRSERRLARTLHASPAAVCLAGMGLALLCLLALRAFAGSAAAHAVGAHVAAAALFFGAAEALLRRRRWPHDIFEHFLLLSLTAGFATDVLFQAGSREPYDALFTVALHLKNISYLLALAGPVIAMRQRFQRAEQDGRTLAEVNVALRREVDEHLRVRQQFEQLTASLEQHVEERTRESTAAREAAEQAKEEAEQARRVEQETNRRLRAQMDERLEVEKALRESESRLQLALSAGRVGIWTWDLANGSVEWDELVHQMFGQDPASFTPSYENALRLIHVDDAAMVHQALQQIVEHGTEFDIAYRVTPADDTVRHLMSRAKVVRDAEGKTARVIGTVVDVSAHKRGEEELRQRSQELSQMVKALRCLHEIAQLLEQADMPLEQIYQRTVELLPRSWHDPANTFARLEAGGQEYRSDGWRDAEYKQCSEIAVGGETIGRLEIGFANIAAEQERFHQEEIRVIRIVAASLERTVEYKRAAENLRRSERRYHGLFTHMISGCALHEIIVDETGKPADYRFLEINPAFERLSGLKAEAVVGRTVREILPDTEQHWIKTYCEVALSGEAILVEQYVPGRERFLEVAAFSPEKGRFATIFNDITERKQAETQRAAEHNLLRTVIDNIPDSIYVKDVQGRYLINNKANLANLGLTAESQARNKTVFDFFPAEHAQLYTADDHMVVESQRPVFDHEEPYRNAQGQLRFYSTTKVPLIAADGKVIGLVGISRDITERKRTAEALETKAKELAASNADLEQFAYVASHDLQEPLRMIAGYTQLLARRYRNRLDSDADEFMRFIVEGAERMRTLIRDLLAYSRVGRTSQRPEQVDAEDCARASLANLKTVLEETKATVELRPLPKLPGQRSQLIQLFQNLIGNAVKYHGDDPPRVSVSAERRGGEWLFTVRDNGIGIDSQYHGQVFDLFRRLHSRGEYSGTGIGLSICKKIVENHGGRIWVDSEPGRGAAFYFTLPADNCAELSGQEAEPTARETKAAVRPESP